jgi:hypothetical protein
MFVYRNQSYLEYRTAKSGFCSQSWLYSHYTGHNDGCIKQTFRAFDVLKARKVCATVRV